MRPIKSSIFAVFLLLQPAFANAQAEEIPNPGPRSKVEPEFLMSDAQKEISENHVAAAIKDLERLTSRYPTYSKHAQAQALLTSLYLKHQNPSAAVKSAQAFLLVDSKSEAAQKIRVDLTDAYLQLGKHTQARATAKDLLAQAPSSDTKARALLILARIDAKEKKWADARAKLDALPAPVASGEADALLLSMGVQECQDAKAPSKKARGDDLWIEYYDHQNFCMKTLAAGQENRNSAAARPEWCQAFAKLNTQLGASHINDFQKKRLQDEFKKTAEIAKPLECDAKP